MHQKIKQNNETKILKLKHEIDAAEEVMEAFRNANFNKI